MASAPTSLINFSDASAGAIMLAKVAKAVAWGLQKMFGLHDSFVESAHPLRSR